MNDITKYKYDGLYQGFLGRMMKGTLTYERAVHFIDRDIKNEQYAERLKNTLLRDYNLLKQGELDIVINEIQETLNMPSKWRIVKRGNSHEIVEVFPQPIIVDKRFKGVKYKTSKSFYIEDEDIYERYIQKLDDPDDTHKMTHREKREHAKRKRAERIKRDEALLAEYEQGNLTQQDLADKYGAPLSTISARIQSARKRLYKQL